MKYFKSEMNDQFYKGGFTIGVLSRGEDYVEVEAFFSGFDSRNPSKDWKLHLPLDVAG